jgi:hypothetical protein
MLPVVCATRRLISVFTRARHLFSSKSDETSPLLYTSFTPKSSKWPLPFGLSDYNSAHIYISLRSHAYYMPCPSHALHFITLPMTVKSTNYQAPHYAIFSSLLLTSLFISTPSSQTFCTLRMIHQVSQPYQKR